MKSNLNSHFKCPKELKIMLNGQDRASRLQMYEAHQSMITWKRKSQTKRSGADTDKA